jgi:anti-sigma factor RsiW
MMSPSQPITEDDLHSYVDGQLPAARRAEVEAHLQRDAAAAARVAAYQQQNAALHQLFDPVIGEAIPPTLRNAAMRPRSALVWRVAAAIAWTFFAGFAGWLARGEMVAAPAVAYRFINEATMAHAVYTPDLRHPVEVTSDSEEHLVKWLTKRLGENVRAPQLQTLGYTLMGGRLLPSEEGPAAQFMYEDAGGKRMTLYLRLNHDVAARDTSFRYAQHNGTGVFYWVEGSLGYALVAQIDKARLLHVAEDVFHQLVNR